ncbi:MAG: hypothetical protein BGO01_16850 [Armatimonadetes bacterium 55-13]|jgi:DNA-binding transcriptional ArsR family regulator|nr:MAG: hypothetical protein BGO01_16850 [Armatimonadetes bacterium 55-13]
MKECEPEVGELRCDAYNDDPLRVARVWKEMPEVAAFEGAAMRLKAIADPVRVRILFALTKEHLCVCELSTLLGLSMPAVSHHLRLLAMSGLLGVKKEGKFACYYLKEGATEGVVGALISSLEDSKTEVSAR